MSGRIWGGIIDPGTDRYRLDDVQVIAPDWLIVPARKKWNNFGAQLQQAAGQLMDVCTARQFAR